MDWKESLKEIQEDGISLGAGDYVGLEALKIAVLALEKQVPKKPTHEATLYKCFTCPSCKNVVDEFEAIGSEKHRVLVPHCRFCGQALDWNEYE